MKLEELQTLLDDRFGGELLKGSHPEDGQACALELLSVAKHIPWTDNPFTIRCWDLRSLNDMDVPNSLRTQHLMPLLILYDGAMDWPIHRQVNMAFYIAIAVVNKILPLLDLPPEIKSDCRKANTIAAAYAAAYAAAHAAVHEAAHAAYAVDAAVHAAYAADAADAAAHAAADAANAAADVCNVFVVACQIFKEAAENNP